MAESVLGIGHDVARADGLRYPAVMAGDDAAGPCWLCRRPLGTRTEWHHPVPKLKGGRETVPLHPICHRAIHARFSPGQLARIGADRAALAAEPGLAGFLQWVAGKPSDFHAPTRTKRR